MRCPDCNKFVSYDTDNEPEADDLSYDGAMVTGDVRRELPCANCGTTLKSATFNMEIPVAVEGADKPCHVEGEEDVAEHEWEVECEAETSDRTQTTDRNGKQIKSSRYMTQYYGVVVNGDVKCSRCNISASFSGADEMPASSYDEEV